MKFQKEDIVKFDLTSNYNIRFPMSSDWDMNKLYTVDKVRPDCVELTFMPSWSCHNTRFKLISHKKHKLVNLFYL